MAKVDDAIASPSQHGHPFSLQIRVMTGKSVARSPVEFDMDASAADMIEQDEVHGFLTAGLDARMDGESRSADAHAAFCRIT